MASKTSRGLAWPLLDGARHAPTGPSKPAHGLARALSKARLGLLSEIAARAMASSKSTPEQAAASARGVDRLWMSCAKALWISRLASQPSRAPKIALWINGAPVPIDENIFPAVAELNRRGAATMSCGQGDLARGERAHVTLAAAARFPSDLITELEARGVRYRMSHDSPVMGETMRAQEPRDNGSLLASLARWANASGGWKV